MEGNVSPQVTPELNAAAEGSVADAQEAHETESTAEDSGEGSQAHETRASDRAAKPKTKDAPAKTQKQMQRELQEADLDALVTVKVNGETKKLSVREVMRLNQLEQASHAKMQEAARIKAQAQAFAKFAKENPRAFMEKLGIDPYEFAEMTLTEKIEYMEMSPEQRELKALKAEKEEREKAAKAEEERAAKDKETQEVTKATEELSRELAQAFRESGLPNSKLYFEQITAEMLYADKRGKPLSAKEAAVRVKERFEPKHREFVRSLDAKAIRDLIGDEKWNELREFDLARVSGNQTPPTGNSSTRPGGKKPVTEKPRSGMTKEMSPEEFQEYIAGLPG